MASYPELTSQFYHLQGHEYVSFFSFYQYYFTLRNAASKRSLSHNENNPKRAPEEFPGLPVTESSSCLGIFCKFSARKTAAQSDQWFFTTYCTVLAIAKKTSSIRFHPW